MKMNQQTNCRKIELTEILDEIRETLQCAETVWITTSGYQDRWLQQRTDYHATVCGAIVRWISREEVHDFVYNLARRKNGTEHQYDESASHEASEISAMGPGRWKTFGAWKTATESSSGQINRQVVDDYLNWLHGNLTREASERCRVSAASLNDFEKQFIRCGLEDCNRSNAALVAAGLRPRHETQVICPSFG